MASTPYQQRWVDRGTDRIGLQWYGDPGGPAPVAVLWPAMGVPAGFYRPFATVLRAAGLAVLVADLRGTGASTPRASRTSRYGYAELAGDVGAVLADLPKLAELAELAELPELPDLAELAPVAPVAGGRPVVLVGHSLGGQACLLHLARSGGVGVAGLALVAVGLPYWRAYADRRRHVVLPFTQAVHATSAVLRVWPGWGFGGRQARGVIRDWSYTARTGRFPVLAGTDPEPAVAALPTPVLAVSVERDQYTPAPTVDHLVGKLAAAPVQRAHYDGGVDHFSWARSGGPIADRVARFAHSLGR